MTLFTLDGGLVDDIVAGSMRRMGFPAKLTDGGVYMTSPGGLVASLGRASGTGSMRGHAGALVSIFTSLAGKAGVARKIDTWTAIRVNFP